MLLLLLLLILLLLWFKFIDGGVRDIDKQFFVRFVLPIFNNVIVAGDDVWFVVNIYGDALFGVVVVCDINSNGKHCAAPSILFIYLFIYLYIYIYI